MRGVVGRKFLWQRAGACWKPVEGIHELALSGENECGIWGRSLESA